MAENAGVLPPLWLAMDIGCIECRAPSKVIGVYTLEQSAQDAVDLMRGAHGVPAMPEGAHHEYRVFCLGELAPDLGNMNCLPWISETGAGKTL